MKNDGPPGTTMIDTTLGLKNGGRGLRHARSISQDDSLEKKFIGNQSIEPVTEDVGDSSVEEDIEQFRPGQMIDLWKNL